MPTLAEQVRRRAHVYVAHGGKATGFLGLLRRATYFLSIQIAFFHRHRRPTFPAFRYHRLRLNHVTQGDGICHAGR